MARGGAGRVEVFPDEACIVGFLRRFFKVEASIIPVISAVTKPTLATWEDQTMPILVSILKLFSLRKKSWQHFLGHRKWDFFHHFEASQQLRESWRAPIAIGLFLLDGPEGDSNAPRPEDGLGDV